MRHTNRVSPNHTHKYAIADRDAVSIMLKKVSEPEGSHSVDSVRLMRALAAAARKYTQSRQEVNQAFFHGLMTGYAVALKHK
jgi:hypothetical protein